MIKIENGKKFLKIILAVVFKFGVIAILTVMLFMHPRTTSESDMSMESFALRIDSVSADVVSWVENCDIKGGGVYVLKLSTEKVGQIVLSNEDDSVPSRL